MLIYKVLRATEWQTLKQDGTTAGAPIDVSDGFVHFSTAEQLAQTLALHFTEEDGLVLLACESEPLGAALKWEPSRGGALFPHLFRQLRMTDVAWSAPLSLDNGIHVLPPEVQ